jgi:hypothetical protein
MATPTLIYCADGNRRFAQIAIDHGFRYGAQLPNTVYFRPYFADQDWRKPDRERYMAALAEHQPTMATVLDWEREDQLPEVLDWAEEAARYVKWILIVPKVIGGIANIPRRINGRDIILALSVPTRYAGTQLPFWEFVGWPVHLLGGSPQAQMTLYSYLRVCADVVSVDGNYMLKMATKYNRFWVPGTATYARDRWWPALREANNGQLWGDGSDKADSVYEAFRRSCEHIRKAWKELV